MIDNFIKYYPFGKIEDSQQESIKYLVEKIKNSSIKDLRYQAYVLATIKHETADI